VILIVTVDVEGVDPSDNDPEVIAVEIVESYESDRYHNALDTPRVTLVAAEWVR
jgi:hypothetical protein